MKTLKVLVLALVCSLNTLDLSAQNSDAGLVAMDAITKCSCSEIILIAGGVEKKYTHSWLEGIKYENGFLVFSKGNNRHLWNASQIVFIEEGNSFIRIFMTQSK
jgi:hypothetical protein